MKSINRKKLAIILTVCILAFFTMPASAACRNEPERPEPTWDVDWEGQGFIQMHTTAYVIQGVTATGTPTHVGICACNTHLGELAVLYTIEGEYLGTFECVDTGATPGLMAGIVIDVWQPDRPSAEAWMARTKGRVRCQWIHGCG